MFLIWFIEGKLEMNNDFLDGGIIRFVVCITAYFRLGLKYAYNEPRRLDKHNLHSKLFLNLPYL